MTQNTVRVAFISVLCFLTALSSCTRDGDSIGSSVPKDTLKNGQQNQIGYSPNFSSNSVNLNIRTVANRNYSGESNVDFIKNLSNTNPAFCHPDVLYFEKGKFGYRYWMAFTPYFGIVGNTGNSVLYENPTIVVSNDGINWIEPVGIKNPLQAPPRQEDSFAGKPGAEERGYWSDVDLMEKDDVFYLYYRGNWIAKEGMKRISSNSLNNNSKLKENAQRTIVVQSSSDGVSWNPIEVCYTSNEPFSPQDNLLLSPSFFYLNGSVYSYDVMNNSSSSYFQNTLPSNIVLRKSTDAVNFTDYKESTIVKFSNMPWKSKNADYSIWHNQAFYADGIYFLCLNVGLVKNSTGEMLYLAYSRDGENFTVFPSPIESLNAYRSCVFKKSSDKNILKMGVVVGDKLGNFKFKEFDVDKSKLKG